MRETRFRAWHNGKMLYHNPMMSTHDFIITPDGKVFYTDEPGYVNGKNQGSIIMQYTGLKDKNGVEIFEGDIIELFWPFVGATYKTKVIWVQDHGRWAMEEIRENGIYHYFGSQDTNLMNIEVIGNIYENPELLGKDEEPRGHNGGMKKGKKETSKS